MLVAAGGAAIILLVVQVGYVLQHPEVWPPDDSIEYWAAARLVRLGQNPYAAELLLPLQQAGGRSTAEAVMMWNPPWTLALVLPLGWLPARLAQLVWLALHLAVLVYCGNRLGQIYGGSTLQRGWCWLLTLAAMPSLFALQAGQITPLVLLGAVLWLEAQTRRHALQAGLALLLLAIKPHLVVLLGLTLLVVIIRQRQWAIVLSGGGWLLGAVGVVMLFRPEVVSDYLRALLHHPPVQWHSPTLGAWLRWWWGAEHFWIQFVPLLIGLLVLGGMLIGGWPRARQGHKLIPPLLLVSLLVAPYGAWPFDLVLLLPAVFAVVMPSVARQERLGLWIWGSSLLLINLGCLALNLAGEPSSRFVWVTPAVGLVYAGAVFWGHPRRDQQRQQWQTQLA
ncbi:MAG: glycosyltransferase 87 family protein [Gemmataceae bacterium]|nr:glycosyltransferase 87 family protein [Gemmataceae bacterium]